MFLNREPLALPPGSVRAIITIILVIVFSIYLLRYQDMHDGLSNILSVIVGFYFGSRTQEKSGQKNIND